VTAPAVAQVHRPAAVDRYFAHGSWGSPLYAGSEIELDACEDAFDGHPFSAFGYDKPFLLYTIRRNYC
jgi:hypothetical protein